MLARVARARLIICASPVRRLCVNAASAVSSATSVPLPIAIPMVDAFIAGASLIPSPTIASGPRAFSSVTALTLSAGNNPALNSSPSSPAIAAAARGLSPVRITPCTPSLCSAATASFASSRRVSRSASIPFATPSCRTVTTVCPVCSNASTSGLEDLPAATISTFLPSTVASIPDPTSARWAVAGGMFSPRDCASRTIACARG